MINQRKIFNMFTGGGYPTRLSANKAGFCKNSDIERGACKWNSREPRSSTMCRSLFATSQQQ